MPDFTYHPFFRPLLFQLPPEASRRLTLWLLATQGRTAAGRALFRAFARARPPAEAAVEAFGLSFPSPVGLGPGIDPSGSAAAVMQELGFGFLTVGPAGTEAVPLHDETEPLRIRERRAIVQSAHAAAPAVGDALARVRSGPEVRVPVGAAVRGDDLARATREAAERADFVTLPPEAARSRESLAALRATTKKPLLLRLSPDWDDEELDRAIDRCVEVGIDGAVAVDGAACPLLPGGTIDGPFLLERAVATAEHVVRRAGDRLPVVGAGGIVSPEDALRFLDAGAKLVEIGAGLVYAGPGLPKRITTAHLVREAPRPLPARPTAEGDRPRASPRRPVPLVPGPPPPPPPEGPRAPLLAGWLLLAVTGAVLLGTGIFALILAATVQLLPNDVAYLGMTVEELCSMQACKIVHFMAHDRVSWGGSIMSIGILYLWLAGGPVRRGEAWAWWTILVSGILGFASFLTYLGFGYLDRWHAGATLLLLPVFGVGLLGSWGQLRGDRSLRAAFRGGARAWMWSPAGMGRLCYAFSAFGMIAGGLTIMAVGMTRVFVPQDLEYMGVGVADLHAIHPRLVSLIAHDRAGFGGGLCSGGVAVMACVWRGTRPAARGLWLALCLSGTVGFASAIGVHPAVGYTSFIHLLPAYAGALTFVLGAVLLRKPMLDPDRTADRFPDV